MKEVKIILTSFHECSQPVIPPCKYQIYPKTLSNPKTLYKIHPSTHSATHPSTHAATHPFRKPPYANRTPIPPPTYQPTTPPGRPLVSTRRPARWNSLSLEVRTVNKKLRLLRRICPCLSHPRLPLSSFDGFKPLPSSHLACACVCRYAKIH